jgi:quercetin dioxygenase-like cupin family protein
MPEARLERTETGLVPQEGGWFVLNARDARWIHADGRGARLNFDGDVKFPQVGVNLFVLQPGEPIGMYHWEAGQEDFLVLSGEALLLIEGEERPLRQWDLAHCPPNATHIIVGAGDGPCAILAVGAREFYGTDGWGGYIVDELALSHGAGVTQPTSSPPEAYAHLPVREPTRYRDGWLPG